MSVPTSTCLSGGHSHAAKGKFAKARDALGVVYGDIGTSPLYAFQVALAATGVQSPTPAQALGIASLMIWSLIIVVAVKYILLVLRADNRGEGGILALLSLVQGHQDKTGLPKLTWYILLGMVGGSFLCSDGIITPAISVVSAIEGLKVAAPSLEQYVVPVALGILAALFAVQRFGTKAIARVFGPVMLVWFGALAGIGLYQVVQHPYALLALNPEYGLQVLFSNPKTALAILGAVFLCLTGCEALYADMGHVGRPAIQLAFTRVVMPALVLNYLGQAALIIGTPAAANNPFYLAAPSWALYPMIFLASAATIIASQALISGIFSLVLQAINMNLLPRMKVIYTSATEMGQIYVPTACAFLAAGTAFVVLWFRTSDAMAAAYGIAVSANMLVTTVLLYNVMVKDKDWKWHPAAALALVTLFATIDGGFLVANSLKILEGGWLPLTVLTVMTFVMLCWRCGVIEVRRKLAEMSVPLAEFVDHIDDPERGVTRVPGVAVWLTKVTSGVPAVLKRHVEANHSLHERVVLFSVETTHEPEVHGPERIKFECLGHGFSRLILRNGFMQEPRIEAATFARLGREAHERHLFLAHETLQRGKESKLPYPMYCVFNCLKNHAAKASDFFQLDPDRVMEEGIRVVL